MTDTAPKSRSLRTALWLLAAWALAMYGLFSVYGGFRSTGVLSLLGTRYEGAEAILLVCLITAVPITLLALAMTKLFDYYRTQR